MDARDAGSPSFAALTARRSAVRLSAESVVRFGQLLSDSELPLLVEPAVENLNLDAWLASNRATVEDKLLRHGGILFRGFAVTTADQFQAVAKALSGSLLEYTERAAPRHRVGAGVFTSTEYPASHPIPLHHEMSYSHNWPSKIWFYCSQPAVERGATPIANDRTVFTRIDPGIKQRFMAKKVMYVRNYGEGVDLPWQEAFQTDDPAAVEAYCRAAHTEVEWRPHGRLRTRQVRQVVAVHPRTGEMVWFNHAHMFHVSNLDPAVRSALLEEFAPDELPRNAFYGDGTPIEDSVLDHIREVYASAALTFTWQKHDLLLLDNFLVSHGREPFVGPRSVLVAMAELYTNDLQVTPEVL